MSDWPDLALPALPTIHPWSMEAMGPGLEALGYHLVNNASGVWPLASRALLWPFEVYRPFSVARVWWANGAAVSGNVDAGIYDRTWRRLGSIGSTAQATISVIQSVALVLTLPPGQYYFALVIDNITATVLRLTPNSQFVAGFGMARMNTAFPLPAAITPALMGDAVVPLCGISQRGFL